MEYSLIEIDQFGFDPEKIKGYVVDEEIDEETMENLENDIQGLRGLKYTLELDLEKFGEGKEGDNLLMYSMMNNLTHTSNEILKRMNSNVLNQVNKHNDNALFIAIGKGRFDLADNIISRKDSDLNHIKNGNNIIMLLMTLSRWDLVEKILRRGNLDLNHLISRGINIKQMLLNKRQVHLANLVA